jgi:hypothetical protein
VHNKIGVKALSSVLFFYRETINPNADVEQDADELADYAATLLPFNFIYKGMEDDQNVSNLCANGGCI